MTDTIEKLMGMELHEVIEIDTFLTVRKVPNGWIYNEILCHGKSMTSTFVPERL